MANRLSHETSPYLLQHADNPVDWYPWGEEVFERARAEDRPIMLSIGYSACHWCHVMAHESFENPDIAQVMNSNFVNIKVDREERPDLDAVYMQAVQAMTGRGGWPMTVFLTPDGVPFYGGTYFPPEDRMNMPGFPRLLLAISEAYRSRREDVLKSGQELLERIRPQLEPPSPQGSLDVAILDNAYRALAEQFDGREGGFGGAPKFPQPMALEFLLRTYRRTGNQEALRMVELSLQRMAGGGIYDQLGGGFHRYSTDDHWLAPHFEKMLYDNAQLARIYLQAFQATGNALYRRIVEETLDYVLREMTGQEGGFYSTQDADSEGEEGKFFVWTLAQVRGALGKEEAERVSLYFDISGLGNWEGRNILHRGSSIDEIAALLAITPEQLEASIERGRRTLFKRRERRVKPGLDDKVLTSWNGLMLRALSEAARVLERADYREAAIRNAEFVRNNLFAGGRLLRSYRNGQSKLDGYLEDYALWIGGLLSLYESTFDSRWFAWARDLAGTMIELFADEAQGGFYDTGVEHEQLIVRPKDLYDNAMPSGNSAAADALLRLSAFTGDAGQEERAVAVLRLLASAIARYPTSFGNFLCAADFALAPRKEVALVGHSDHDDMRALVRTVFAPYLPNKVVAGAAPDDAEAERVVPLLEGRLADAGRARAFVCEHFVCQMPADDPQALARQLGVDRLGLK